jgi:hypothetical protein
MGIALRNGRVSHSNACVEPLGCWPISMRRMREKDGSPIAKAWLFEKWGAGFAQGAAESGGGLLVFFLLHAYF